MIRCRVRSMPFARRGSSKVGPRPYLVGTATSIAAYAQGIGANKNLIVPCDSTGKLLPPTSLIADAHQVRLLVHAWTFRNENFFLPVDFRIGDSADLTFPAQYGNAFAEYKLFFSLGLDGLFSDNPDTAVEARDSYFE